jgi:hypothetical protein
MSKHRRGRHCHAEWVSAEFISEPIEPRRLLAAFLPPTAQLPNLNAVSFVGRHESGTFSVLGSATINALDLNAVATNFGSRLDSKVGATALALISHGSSAFSRSRSGGTSMISTDFLRTRCNGQATVL